MSATATKMSWAVKFTPVSKGRKILALHQEDPPCPQKGRITRVSRLMALALKFEKLIHDGVVKDYAELARLGRVTRARISQIMSLLNLAPDLVEALLFLPRVERGREPFRMRDVLPVAVLTSWTDQRRAWKELFSKFNDLGAAR